MTVTKAFLLLGIVGTLACFSRRRTRAGVLAAYFGAVAVLIGWALSRHDASAWPLLLSLEAFAVVAVFLAAGPDVFNGGDDEPRTQLIRGGKVSRTLSGGLMGATPGLALVVVPLVLHELGMVGSGVTDFVYLGIPMLPLGLVVGLAFGATSGSGPRPDTGQPMWP